MNLDDLKNKYIKDELKINEAFGNILSIIDFGNVNYWYEKDRQIEIGDSTVQLSDGEKITLDLEKLKFFSDAFSKDVRFYYGVDAQKFSSIGFIRVVRDAFGKHKTITKNIQKVRHYISDSDPQNSNRSVQNDTNGREYVHVPKCNFDVEIAVDTIKLLDHYDTMCLFSGDADFVHLARYLKSKGKKIILIKGGNITSDLRKSSDLVINAQQIKKYITKIKQKPDIKSGFADRKPESTGRTTS